MGLLLLEFKDLIRYGDGERDLQFWKVMFLYFRATGHTNYTLEAMSLLLLTATSLCRATDMESLREYTWLLW